MLPTPDVLDLNLPTRQASQGSGMFSHSPEQICPRHTVCMQRLALQPQALGSKLAALLVD
jgi:hypothetical protein